MSDVESALDQFYKTSKLGVHNHATFENTKKEEYLPVCPGPQCCFKQVTGAIKKYIKLINLLLLFVQ